MKILKRLSLIIISCLLMTLAILPHKTIPAQADYPKSTLSFDFKYCQSDARKMLSLINAFRTGKDAWQLDESGKRVNITGLSNLKYDYELEKIAMQRAAELVLMFSHQRPNGTYVFDMLNDLGWYGYGSENIAYGTSYIMSTSQTFTLWQETNQPYSGQGHRRNMLSKNAKTVGIGCVEYAGMKHWVQVFSSEEYNTKETAALNGNISTKIEVYDDDIIAFLKRMYKLCLNRNYDSGGLAYWWTKLYTKQITAAEAARGFFVSKEMSDLKLNDNEFVERCYKVMMDRASDKGGKKYWLDRIGNGMSREYVVKGFIDSKEFTNICNKYGMTKGTINVSEARDKNYGITSFVARCYTKALGRKYDVNGLNFWCNKMLNASNVKQAAIDVAGNGFFHSKEFKDKKLSNSDYIKVLYRTFLGREYDNNGLNYWLKELSSGKSRDYVLNGFANSKEFSDIMASYGIK